MIEITEDLLRRLTEGDEDARAEAQELLPKPEPLFGRWATHPEYGRVLCVSDKPLEDGLVWVAFPDNDWEDGARTVIAPVSGLTFDPLTLTTVDEFESAPVGTVVVSSGFTAREKRDGFLWNGRMVFDNADMAERGPWSVVRWGKGEQE